MARLACCDPAHIQSTQAVRVEEDFAPADRPLALQALRRLDKPCIAYKILGAGRLSLEDGLSDVALALRPKDGILMGMFPPDRPDLITENVAAIARL